MAHAIQKIKNDGFPELLDYHYDKSLFLEAHRIWQQIAVLSVDMANQIALLDELEPKYNTDIFNL